MPEVVVPEVIVSFSGPLLMRYDYGALGIEFIFVKVFDIAMKVIQPL